MARLASKYYNDSSGLQGKTMSVDRGWFLQSFKLARPFLGHWFRRAFWVTRGLFCVVRFQTSGSATRWGSCVQEHLCSGAVPAFKREPSSLGRTLRWGQLMYWAPLVCRLHALMILNSPTRNTVPWGSQHVCGRKWKPKDVGVFLYILCPDIF